MIYRVKSNFLKDELSEIKSELRRLSDRLEENCLRVNAQNYDIKTILKNTETNQEFLSNEYVALYNRKSSKLPRVLLCGFYGARNVGDELMLSSLLEILQDTNIDITILLSNNYDADSSVYAPYKTLHYPKRSSDVMAIAENFDVVVWGGGALLDDVEYEYRGQYSTMTYILMSISKAMIKTGGQVIVYGVSTNDVISNKDFLSDLQLIIDKSVFFSLRDTNSLMVLKKSGIKIDKVKLLDDLSIFALTNKRTLKKKEKSNIVVGINLILKEDELDESVNIVNKIVDIFNGKIKVYFIPFYDYQRHDERMYSEVLKRLKAKDGVEFEVLRRPNNIEELMQIFTKCDFVFAMRYHAILTAALTNNRVAMIDYQSKHRHYVNKNNYIKEKYAPGVPVLSVDDFLKKDYYFDIDSIPYSGLSLAEIGKISNRISDTVKKTIKTVRRKEGENR